MSLDLKNSFELYIEKSINNLKAILETSTIGEIRAINNNLVDVYLPTRDKTVPDVTLFTLGGGGEYIAFPVKVGDTCLLITSKDDIIDWLSDKEINSSYSFDINGSFAFVGVDNIAKAIPIVTTTTMNVSKIKIQNDSEELISLLSDLVQLLIDVTTPTVSGPQPFINNADFVTIKSKFDTFKE